MNQVIDSNLFMKENLRIGAYTTKSGLVSFHAVKDLLYVDKSFTSAASPQECQILLDMAPPPLHQASKGVELLNYGKFPPLQAPPLQGPFVMTSSPGDGKALRGRQTWAQPLGWPLSHQVCWVVSELVWG